MLHEVIHYARSIGLESEPGFAPKSVRWLIVFDDKGAFLNVVDLRGDNKKSKGREFAKAPELTFGELISNKMRHFLIDSVDKVVLLTKDEPTDKDLGDHASYVSLLRKGAMNIAPLAVIAISLDDPATLQRIQQQLSAQKAKPTDTATIAVMDGVETRIFVGEESWHDWWREFLKSLRGSNEDDDSTVSNANLVRCFVSGKLVTPVPTQNKIRGLSDVGGLATGDVVASFDKESFGHYGFNQGENAAIGLEQSKAFSDALNHLIQHRSHRLASTKIIYWYSQPIAAIDDPLADDIFGHSLDEFLEEDVKGPGQTLTQQERLAAESTAKRLLDSIRSGEKQELTNCTFYALVLSGNSGRVVVRDWIQGRFEHLIASVNAWLEDLAVVSRDGKSTIRRHKFAALLAAFVRDLKDVPSPTVASLWRCALQRDREIPYAIMVQTLNRVRIDIIQDQAARHARLALLKAFCVRNSGVPSMSAEIDESLNSPAYLSGRIMALLASIQERALGNVGAGVVQRYYAAASATPALVLGRLVRTAQIAHLPKIDGGLRHYFESQLSELWVRMKSAPPTTLSLEEQTLFAMGFYQQQASRYQKKLESNELATVADNTPDVEPTS